MSDKLSSSDSTIKQGGTGFNWAPLIDVLGLLLVLSGMIAFFGWQSERFITLSTARAIAENLPDLTMVAVGMTFVLLIGGIDLSVGSVLALCGALVGVVAIPWGLPAEVGMCLGLAAAAMCGLANGLISEKWKIPSFIVTLGMLEMARGASYLVTDSSTIFIGESVQYLSQPVKNLGVSPSFLLAIGTVVVAQLVLSKTVLGRYMIAIGTNEEAVVLSGINPKPTKVMVFAISGFLAGMAGLIQLSRLAAANPNAGGGFELKAIAAVVIGGTSLMGGRGSVIKSFLGVIIIVVLDSGLVQIGASEPTKRVVTGLVIVLAVITDAYRNKISWRQLFRRNRAGS